MTRWAAVRLAVGTLTVLPAGAVAVDARVAGRAMVLGPVAALPLGWAAAGVAAVAEWAGATPLLVGLLVVAVLALGTRALHLDGLADTVDGLGSGAPPERALAIMRQGDLGPMGAVALVLVLGVQAAAIGQLVARPAGAGLLGLAVVVSRAALVILCARRVPAARPAGLGAAVAGSVPGSVGVAVWGLAGGAVTVATALAGGTWEGGLVTVAVAGLAVGGLRRRCVRRLGGITGDVLGAGVELCFTLLVVGLALA